MPVNRGGRHRTRSPRPWPLPQALPELSDVSDFDDELVVASSPRQSCREETAERVRSLSEDEQSLFASDNDMDMDMEDIDQCGQPVAAGTDEDNILCGLDYSLCLALSQPSNKRK